MAIGAIRPVRAKPWIEDWHPDDDELWERRGEAVARRNITFSIFAEFLAFCVWTLRHSHAGNRHEIIRKQRLNNKLIGT